MSPWGRNGHSLQMHLGTALIRSSHPMHVAGLIERHPSTRFLLMPLVYPWSRDLLGMAFVYRNIWMKKFPTVTCEQSKHFSLDRKYFLIKPKHFSTLRSVLDQLPVAYFRRYLKATSQSCCMGAWIFRSSPEMGSGKCTSAKWMAARSSSGRSGRSFFWR